MRHQLVLQFDNPLSTLRSPEVLEEGALGLEELFVDISFWIHTVLAFRY